MTDPSAPGPTSRKDGLNEKKPALAFEKVMRPATPPTFRTVTVLTGDGSPLATVHEGPPLVREKLAAAAAMERLTRLAAFAKAF